MNIIIEIEASNELQVIKVMQEIEQRLAEALLAAPKDQEYITLSDTKCAVQYEATVKRF